MSAASTGLTTPPTLPLPPVGDPGGAAATPSAGPTDANVGHRLRSDRHRHRSRVDGCHGGAARDGHRGRSIGRPPAAPAVTEHLALATLAVGQPMGQQVYERELADRAAAELGPDWSVDRIVVRTLRSPLTGTVRGPSRLLIGASPA